MFPIDELLTQVARSLELASFDHGNGQVTPVPTERIVRWYQTRGLIDAPASYRGRTALYGARHVAQVVAIKALQARGRSLDEITSELAGLDDHALAGLSGVAFSAPAVPAGASTSIRRNSAFWLGWAEAPAGPPQPEPEAGPAPGTRPTRVAVELPNGFTVILPPDTDLSPGLADALHAVADLLNKTTPTERST